MLNPLSYLFRGSLVLRILIAMVLAIILFWVAPSLSASLSVLGKLFVTLLRAIAPFLVFILLVSSIIKADSGSNKTIKSIVILYVASSLIAAAVSAFLTFVLPHVHLNLSGVNTEGVQLAKESTAGDVLMTQFLRMFDNPVSALVNSNFMALLTWSVAFGVAFRYTGKVTRQLLEDVAAATTRIVSWIVELAPIGVFGIFSGVLTENGISELVKYAQLIGVLLIVFAVLAFVYFPIVGFLIVRRNPFPLLFKCLVVSGVPAFFSRSSAANIPVNLAACEQFGLSPKVAAFTIPLGANINLTACAGTITVLSITAAFSLGLEISLPSAILACFVTAICALGASGVPGGSIIMIPIAASLFGISPEVASQMVAIGFLIGVIQDSVETAINSAGDLYYTALVCEKYGANAEHEDGVEEAAQA